LELTTLPKSIAIIGGGYIGCEFASLFLSLGVQVIILEALPSILTTQPPEISKMMHDIFTKKGAKIMTGVFVEGIDKHGDHVRVKLRGQEAIDAGIALVSVGRSLNTKGIGLERAGVEVDAKGIIPVNEKLETNVEGIYAIGDVTGKWMLAHVASHQGIVAASNCCGHKAKLHYEAVPAVVFTHPEIATVGLTLQQALEKGYAAKSGSFPFQALGKAQAIMETAGFAQIVTDTKTGQILGAQVIGHDASNLIAEMALAVQNELTLECLIDTIHAHPTNSEAWLEAALVVHDTPIHLPPKPKKV
jgi:dihydrolipoamide dehydrogenase